MDETVDVGLEELEGVCDTTKVGGLVGDG